MKRVDLRSTRFKQFVGDDDEDEEPSNDVFDNCDLEIDENKSESSGGKHGHEINAEMDIEIDDDDDDEYEEYDNSTLYFSVSLWRAKGLLGNNNNGRSSDPYVLVKYGEQELKTRVIDNNLNPVWKSHVMFAYEPDVHTITLYIFDYESLTSDDLLGKVHLELPTPLPDEPVFSVHDREWFQVMPCLISEQDSLADATTGLTRAIRLFQNDDRLFKVDSLGDISVSVTAFRLQELPSLVRERESTIDRLRSRLSTQRRLSQSTLADTTTRLQAELAGARRDAAELSAEAKLGEAKLRAVQRDRAQDVKRLADMRAKLALIAAERDAATGEHKRLGAAKTSATTLLEDAQIDASKVRRELSRAENERDKALMQLRKLEKSAKQLNHHGHSPRNGQLDTLSLVEVQDRIQGLTLAYYWMKRKQAKGDLPDEIRKQINDNSLPTAPKLRLKGAT